MNYTQGLEVTRLMAMLPEADLTVSFAVQQKLLIEEINSVGDVLSQYTYLIEKSTKLPVMTDEVKEKSTKVDKCQSQVFLYLDDSATDSDGLFLQADSDTLIIRGVLYCMLSLINGRSEHEITSCSFDFVDQTELRDAFSDSRLSGFRSIQDAIARLCRSSSRNRQVGRE